MNMQVKNIQGFFIFLMTILALVLTISPITQADSTEIDTIDDLWDIRNNLSGDYVLMNDLDFENINDYEGTSVEKSAKMTENTTGFGWLPIGNYDNEFTGTFDGQNYNISNLFVNRDDDIGLGLFGYAVNSNIININLIDVEVSGYDSVGGLSGFNMGYISNCSATGSVTGVYYVGGLVGDNFGSSITKSYTEVQVEGETCVGGLIGSNAESIVEQSYSTGDVNGLDQDDNTMGGLIGYNAGNITNCYATGDVESESLLSWIIGGLVGENDGGSIANCYSTGYVDGGGVLGGLIGRNNTGTTGAIENSFWDINTSGQTSSDGGNGKTTSQMKNFTTFNESGWDIAEIEEIDDYNGEIWYIDIDGNHYPHLGWELTNLPNNPPNISSSPNPSNSAIDISINATLSWIGGDPDSGDTVTYDVYFEAGDSSPDVLVSDDQLGTSYDPGTMIYNTHYYWQIVATDNHGSSTIGSIWDFTTLNEPNNPPYEPSDPTPVNYATEIDVNANLSWTGGDPDGDTVTYYIYFGTNSNPPLYKPNHNNTSFDPGEMISNTTYYWKIVSMDNYGETTTGPIWEFTTKYVYQPPYEPYNPTPRDNKTSVNIYQTLQWTGGDPNIEDTVTYDVYFGTNNSLLPKLESNQSSETYDPGEMNYDTTYYWEIIAWDNHGAFTTGDIWSFTTGSKSTGGSGGGGAIQPANKVPVANASASDKNGFVNRVVTFNGSYSYDEDGEITNYTWSFGDNNYGYDIITTHTYKKEGVYKIKLTVTDNDDVSNSDSFNIVISQPNNQPITPQIDGPKTGKQNIEYNFTLFSTDPDNDKIQYVINWGDDQTNETDFFANGTMYTEKHKWTSPGVYKIRIYAIDINSAESGLAETSILIDIFYCKNIGYFIDEDSNGIYDSFYSNQTGIKTVTERLENGSYLINNDLDSDWNYIYNTQTGTLRAYSSKAYPGETETDNTIFYVLALVVIIVLLIFFAMLGKKPKEEKKIVKEEKEQKQEKAKEKPKKGKSKKQTTKKKQTKTQKKKSITKKKGKKRK